MKNREQSFFHIAIHYFIPPNQFVCKPSSKLKGFQSIDFEETIPSFRWLFFYWMLLSVHSTRYHFLSRKIIHLYSVRFQIGVVAIFTISRHVRQAVSRGSISPLKHARSLLPAAKAIRRFLV